MKRVLVLRLSALGDVIHTIPAVAALQEEATVQWVVEAPYRELVEIVAGVEAIPVRMKQWARSPSLIREAIRSMRAETSVDFQGLIKSAMLGWLAGANERIGFDAHAIREKPALLFTNRKVHVDTTKHVIEQNLQLARGAAGFSPPNDERRAEARRSTGWDAYTGAVEKTNDILILPGAGKPNKLWSVDRWKQIAKNTNALIAWGPNERELAESIGGRLAPPTNLRELASLLRSAKLVIGGDTGPLHLAAALNTRVVGLYGPTHAWRNGPHGQLDHCIQEKSMDAISVEAVMNMVERVAAE
ncbi:MAG TPA: lipopolysaccharide heptosyltransferase I [Thermoanaerobaculia bacterium]|nr:lipopolysaccharide heptosyltransferase I [Thermoanaerobaculia bacterium]